MTSWKINKDSSGKTHLLNNDVLTALQFSEQDVGVAETVWPKNEKAKMEEKVADDRHRRSYYKLAIVLVLASATLVVVAFAVTGKSSKERTRNDSGLNATPLASGLWPHLFIDNESIDDNDSTFTSKVSTSAQYANLHSTSPTEMRSTMRRISGVTQSPYKLVVSRFSADIQNKSSLRLHMPPKVNVDSIIVKSRGRLGERRVPGKRGKLFTVDKKIKHNIIGDNLMVQEFAPSEELKFLMRRKQLLSNTHFTNFRLRVYHDRYSERPSKTLSKIFECMGWYQRVYPNHVGKLQNITLYISDERLAGDLTSVAPPASQCARTESALPDFCQRLADHLIQRTCELPVAARRIPNT